MKAHEEALRPDPAAGHVSRNRQFWDGLTAERGEYGDQDGFGRRRWAAVEPVWGDWSVPESTLRLLPRRLAGLATIELGCGTAYVSSWLARRGARPVALDASRRQLAIARKLQGEFDLRFPLVLGDAEAVPARDGSFDLAVSEYGACCWCDPHRWVPEAARVLRPGGELVFLTPTPIGQLCTPEDGRPAGDRLLHDYFTLGRTEMSITGTVEFQLPYGEWIRLLRRCGFDVEDLVEIQAPEGGRSPWPYISAPWARRWPSEQVWKVRRR